MESIGKNRYSIQAGRQGLVAKVKDMVVILLVCVYKKCICVGILSVCVCLFVQSPN